MVGRALLGLLLVERSCPTGVQDAFLGVFVETLSQE